MSTTAAYDTTAASSLEAFARGMMSAAAEGNFSQMHTEAEEASMFDLDMEGAPIARRGPAEINPQLDAYSAMAGQAEITTTVTAVDCHATANHGYCTLEFEQVVVAGGQTMGPLRQRATLVARRAGDHWIWTHWHASMREMPPTGAAPTSGGEAPAPG